MKKTKNANKNEPGDCLRIAVAPSFFVGDDGELHYQASVYPTQGEEAAWLVVLFGEVGSAPEMISQGSDVPAGYRAQVAGAVRQSTQTEFDKLVAVVNSQTKVVIQ